MEVHIQLIQVLTHGGQQVAEITSIVTWFSYKITSRAGYYTFTKCQLGWFLHWCTLDVHSRGDGYNIASGAG